MKEKIEIGSLEKPALVEPANQVIVPAPIVEKNNFPSFAPKLVAGFLSLLLLSLSFLAGRQFFEPRQTQDEPPTNREQVKQENEIVPEVYLAGGGEQEPCSLEFTTSGMPVCLVVKITDSNGQEITDFSQLKVGDQIRLLVNGSYRAQINKARFQVNQAADSSWCLGTGLNLVDNWCETTNEQGIYYYLDYSLPQTGEFSIGAMIFDSANQTWQ